MKIILPEALPTANTIYKKHWRKYQKETKRLKELVFFTLLEQKIPKKNIGAVVEIDVIVFLPTKRKRDIDNIFFKPVQDAIVEWGIILDDNYTVIKRLSLSMQYAKNNPRTEIIISPVVE